MSRVFLKSNHSIKSISRYVILSLILLVLSGFYKNGVKLYMNGLTNIYGLFKPLIITLLGFFIGVIVNLIYETFFTKNRNNIGDKVFGSFHPVYGILVASIISINTSIWIFCGVTLLVFILSKFIKTTKINVVSLVALIIILIINLNGEFSFLNQYEATRTLDLTGLNYLVGMGSGGINTSFVLLLMVSFLLLAKEDFYKKAIPLYSSITFFIIMVAYVIVTNQVEILFDNIFGNGILFSFVYLATDPLSSAYTKKGQIVYGIILGMITFGLYLIEPTLAVLGAILIVSMLHSVIDKICLK